MLSLFNTKTKKKEPIKATGGREFKIYTCGPTVYDFAHIGNLRAYLMADILVRFLRFQKQKVHWVMNITDIDDKTIRGAKAIQKSLSEFSGHYQKEFVKDLKILNILPADQYPKATENIKEIQDLIVKLYQKGFAYEKSGSLYFNIRRFPNYGRFSQTVLDDKKVSRIDADQYEKEATGDFVLWKKAKPDEPKWDLKLKTKDKRQITLSGRPGWHIECSAMALKYLGQTIDIHMGGIDLMFPHHENEIAQSEAATGKEFAKIWMHNEHLLVDGKKMSKSLNNFYTLRDLITRGFDPLAFRYLCLQSHYQSKMNFSIASLRAAEKTLAEIRKLGQRKVEKPITSSLIHSVTSSLDNNLDTPKALAILHSENNFKLWQYFEPVLGLGLDRLKVKKEKLKAGIEELIKEREKLRKEKKFEKADEIRKKLLEQGYEVEDTKKGTRVVKVA